MAHALTRAGSKNPGGSFVIVSADHAAVRAAMSMGFGDRIESLESVLRSAGIKPDAPLKDHYTRERLSSWKTQHELGM